MWSRGSCWFVTTCSAAGREQSPLCKMWLCNAPNTGSSPALAAGSKPTSSPSLAGGARAALEWAEGTWRRDAGRQTAWRGGWRWPWLGTVTCPAHADTQEDNTEPFGTWGSSVGSGVWMESHESQEGPAPALTPTHTTTQPSTIYFGLSISWEVNVAITLYIQSVRTLWLISLKINN